jgi:hypothetical protein
MDEIKILEVTSENVTEFGIYCIRDKKSPGYKAKADWFKSKINNGLKIVIASDNENKQLGFIEYIPSEIAWRPVKADNYLFIQCIAMFVKDSKRKNIATRLLQYCEQEARIAGKSGVCVMSSNGPWIANKSLFEKNGFKITDKLERFELMTKTIDVKSSVPRFNDWTKQREKYKGWNLIYSDQCPWHAKSITDLSECASQNNIQVKVKKLTTPGEAQNAPSGFGTFSLVRDGRLLEDHYLSRTRFQTILYHELKKSKG